MSKLTFEQRQRLETEVLPAVISDPEYAAATIVRLEAERDRLIDEGVGYSQQTVDAITKEREALRARVAELEAERASIADLAMDARYWKAESLAANKRIAELEAERDRLRELLRPAAAFADVLDSDEIFEEMREPETIIATLDDAVLTASDCYAARAALEGKG